MNENYIIDGNAVYEIDSGCAKVRPIPDEYDSRGNDGKVYKKDNDTDDGDETNKTDKTYGIDAADCGRDGRVSVFF